MTIQLGRAEFCEARTCPPPNELRIRVQPDEAITLSVAIRVPGFERRVETRALDLRYRSAFPGPIPEAYESLLLEVLQGERSLFPGREELGAAWVAFAPLLAWQDREDVRPLPYPAGSAGPPEAEALARRFGLEDVCL